MAWLFPENVHWWNYVLLIPALLQTFVFLPLWHRTPCGPAAMRTKIVYAWAHLFAFRDRVVGRPLSWSPTGGSGGRSSRRIHLVKTLIVAWPLTTVALVVSGPAVHMDSVLDLDYWPPLAALVVYTLAAVLVLQPLSETMLTARQAPVAQRGRARSLSGQALVPLTTSSGAPVRETRA